VPLAGNVNDEMNFGEAFATAREETGPGGIFTWQGSVYGTYYKDEWNQLSPEYREAFANYPYQKPEDGYLADNTQKPDSNDEDVTGDRADVPATDDVEADNLSEQETGAFPENLEENESLQDDSEVDEGNELQPDEDETSEENEQDTTPETGAESEEEPVEILGDVHQIGDYTVSLDSHGGVSN
jgi:hypothetical protein